MDLEKNYFTVTPMDQRMSLEPGQVYTGKITVVNPVDAVEAFDYQVGVMPYSVVGDEYKADLVTRSKYNALADWIVIDEPKGTLKPNESKEVNFTVTVPENVPVGGQYAAIVVSQDKSANEKSNNVAEDSLERYAEYIMPETTRYIQRDINEGLPLVGVVQVEQTVYYNNNYSKEVRNVVICPVWFMAVVGAVLGLVILE